VNAGTERQASGRARLRKYVVMGADSVEGTGR
jgi:hypothetical protein